MTTRAERKTRKPVTLRWRKYELLALQLLPGAKDCNADTLRNFPWDLEWNGYRVDVKSKEAVKNGTWPFRVKARLADYYLLFCLRKESVAKVLLIPRPQIKRHGITIATKSKYDAYQISR